MATFGEVLVEIQDLAVKQQRESAQDIIRRRHLAALAELTQRNVVIYYSGWLARSGPEFSSVVSINDEDKHGFMATFAGLDFDKGLDLILHTPGGDIAATESIIDYIRGKFQDRVRVIVPQISMSGGTMIALAAKQIVMGRHSNLGPIDPQLGGKPAIAILKEFDRARQEIAADPNAAPLWIPILQQYQPTLLSFADQAIKWSREIAVKALTECQFLGDPEGTAKAGLIVEFLLSQDLHHAHGRHLHRDELSAKGLNIVNLEDDPALQDAVLTVHHATMLSLSNAGALKIIENHKGIAHVKVSGQMLVPQMMFPNPAPAPAPAVPPAGAKPNLNQLTLSQRLKLAWHLLTGQ